MIQFLWHEQSLCASFLKMSWAFLKISGLFPDILSKQIFSPTYFKIPWQFPDLEKILIFSDFSLMCGNPKDTVIKNVKNYNNFMEIYLERYCRESFFPLADHGY